MIFFSNAEGTINAVVSSPVYQGSNYANEVVFVAPFVPVSVVTVLFIKPNGEYTPTALMTVKELTGIKDEKGNAFNAWTYLVPEAYTEYSGILTAQFKVTNGNTVLATASSSFNVQKGVPNVTPEPPEDIYQQILSALSEIKQDIANLEDGTTEVGKAKEAEKAEQAEYYTTASGDKSVNTIEAQFSNKLDKQTGVPSYPQVYAVEGNTQKLLPVSNGSAIAPNDRIAQYTSSGTLFTQPPEADSDTTNKGYVDGEIKKSNDEQMVINERIVEILDGIEIVKVSALEYNLMVDETIKGTINIPKDQFLKSVSYDPETHVLTFIFLTSDGEVPTTIDMSSLVDVYQAGNGLTLANNTFSIKLDPSSNNALTLSAAGLMLDNTPLEKAAEDIEILNSDIPKSAKETGAFISGNNTLAGAKVAVEVESKNLFTTAGFRETWQGTTVQNGTNGFTYTRDPNSTQSSYVEYYCETPNGEITISFETSIAGSLTGKSPNRFLVFDGLPIVGAQIAIVNLGEDQTNQSHVVTVKATKGGISFRFYANVLDTTETGEEYTAVFENVQFESGASATAYTPYLPAGTEVEVNACGKNLFDENGVTSTEGATFTELTAEQVKVTATTEIPSGNAGYAGVAQKNIKAGQTVTINASWTTSAPANTGRLAIYWRNANIFIGQQLYSNTPLTVTIPNSTNENDVVYFYFYVATGGGSAAVGDEVTYTNITVNLGEKDLGFSTPVSATYQSAVGETIEVEQYDRVTNIFSNTTGAAVSTQFLQSTRYELDTKPVSLAGTYAERPTGTYPYVVLYTANDAGKTYRLERDTGGSVSSNWVNISSAGGTGGGFTPRGEWNSTTTYNENDLVSLNGSSYICIEENTNATPASNPDKWMVNAEKGETGATGTTGSAGIDGHSVYTSTDVCSANVGETCGAYKDTTSAKGIGDVIITANGKVFTVERETVISGRGVWEGICTAIIIGPKGDTGARGDGWYRVDSDYLDTVTSIPRNVIYPTTPATLNVNETVIFGSGRLASVASQSGDAVTVTLRDIYFKGPAGANGANGKDYLIYKGDTLTGTSGPNNYSGIIPVDDFNRVPATDEYFTALYKQTLTSGSQLSYCLLQVATASDSGALCQVVKAELLNAPKYIHHIRYTNGSDIVYFTYINDSSDNYTATNDMYLLTTELANKQLDAKERSLMANGIVGGKTIIAVYGEADGVIWGVPTSGEDVAFTKANCKIDDLTIKL